MALFCSVLAAFFLAGLALTTATSFAAPGHIGEALALRAVRDDLVRGKANPQSVGASSFVPEGRERNGADGRYIYPKDLMLAAARDNQRSGVSGRLRPLASGGATSPLVYESVQTFDVFAPPPSFQPVAGPLTPTNLDPIWSADEKTIIFSSNRSADGLFHLYSVSANGSAVTQITSGPGNEFFPALNLANNKLAFTSDAKTPGNQDLFVIGQGFPVAIPAAGTTVDVSTLTPIANRPNTANTFANVGRPTWAPGDTRIAFSATTINSPGSGYSDPGAGHSHIYYLYVSPLTGGYLSFNPASTTPNPPAQLTDGQADDTDPAWSPDGNYVAFSSTASAFTSTGQAISPTTAPAASSVAANTTSRSARGIFLLSGGTLSPFGSVPGALASVGGRVTVAGTDDFGPAWSFNTTNEYFNPSNNYLFLAFARGAAQGQPHDVNYFRLINNVNTGSITPETAAGGSNAVVNLNSIPNNPTQSDDPTNKYDDVYPSWSPFGTIFSIIYASNRSVTYNDPATGNPSETPISLPDGSNLTGYANNVGTGYSGLLETQVINLDPPTLLRFNGDEVVHVNNGSSPILPTTIDPTGARVRQAQPKTPLTFTVRLSNREAGLDDNNVYLQIKDPDSKYQDSQSLEHKVFATDLNEPYTDSGSASFYLFNHGESFGSLTTTYDGINASIGSGFTVINNIDYPDYFGMIGGNDGTSPISVMTLGGGTAPFLTIGQEYECQYVNPSVAEPFNAAGDYGTPYYLAGIDDQIAFSGVSHPARPNVEWLKLTRSSQQDAQGGVLYSATWTSPTAASDFYLDVIAYDKAVFPALPADVSNYVGQSINWRIYDNVWGFTTASFNGNNDILVVSDYALGQKFALSTFGGSTGLQNIPPTLYGAESYLTDIDVGYLPNAVDFWAPPTSTGSPPPIPAATSFAYPTTLTATATTNSVILVWAGSKGATLYNIYRATAPGGPFTVIATLADPNLQYRTTYTDTAVTANTTYYYEVTVATPAPESIFSNVASAIPGSNAPIFTVTALNNSPGTGRPNAPVLNSLGVGSYLDGSIDDGGRSEDGYSYVRSQRYSIWRILSRGPVDQGVLQAYGTTTQAQPAVNDAPANAANGGTPVPAANVTVAQRCVVWITPFTGDLETGAGSLDNPDTQVQLRQYIASGGRLFVSGQDVASTLTSNGSINNSTATDFLPGVLNAKWDSSGSGTENIQGVTGRGHRVSYDSLFNVNQALGINNLYYEAETSGPPQYKPPSNVTTLLANDDIYAADPATAKLWRTDASLGQLNRFSQSFGGFNLVGGQIDTIAPVANANGRLPQTDFTFTRLNGGGVTGSNVGLITNEDFKTGSRFVYASFGLESVGVEYYALAAGAYFPRNNRQNIMHNIVSYLRTGTISGTVRDTTASGSGQPVSALVYAVANEGVAIPGPRQVFTAQSDPSTGNFTISGLEPGAYIVYATKAGYSRATTSASYLVQGDSIQRNVGLNITQLPAGAIAGTVTDSTTGAPVPNATVTYTSSDGQTTVSGQTNNSGAYSIQNVPAGSAPGITYTGVATKGSAVSSTHTIAVQSGQTTSDTKAGTDPTSANFVLPPPPGTIRGTVTDSNGAPLPGATVTFTPTTGTAISVTTAADGTYTSDTAAGVQRLPAGTYTVTASLTGYANGSASVTLTAGATVVQNFALVKAQNGTLGGLVADATTGQPVAGATVTIADTTGKVIQTLTGANATSGTTTAPAAPAGDGNPINYSTTIVQGTYQVTASISGLKSNTVTVVVPPNGFGRADFTGSNAIQPLHSFPAGLNFFSVPYDYTSAGSSVFDTLFGSLNTAAAGATATGNRSHAFVWQPQLLQYVADPTPPANTIQLGHGYWIRLLNSVPLYSAGTVPTGQTASVSLSPTWNMIGNASQGQVSLSRLTFANPLGGSPITFAQASSTAYNLVSPILYRYDVSTGTYQPVEISAPPTSNGQTTNITTSLQPYQAYWIRAYTNCTLLLPTSGD